MAACFAQRAAVAAAQSSRVPVKRAPFSSFALSHNKAPRVVALRAGDVQEAVVEEGDDLVEIDSFERMQQREEDAEEKKFKADFQERTVQVRRVTKVVKGGKQLSFRAVVIVGDLKGRVGVGCAAAKEVVAAVRKASVDARKNLITVPLTKDSSFPHKIVGEFGAASVMLRPASDGTGVIAGGSVRVVMELAGVKNGFGKQLGSKSPLNNAQATLDAFRNMRTWHQVAEQRDVSLEYLFGKTFVKETEALAA